MGPTLIICVCVCEIRWNQKGFKEPRADVGIRKCKQQAGGLRRSYLSQSPLQSARTGMVKGCHTGFNVFFTTSVLWQIVNLEDIRQKRQRKKINYYLCVVQSGKAGNKNADEGAEHAAMEATGKSKSNPAVTGSERCFNQSQTPSTPHPTFCIFDHREQFNMSPWCFKFYPMTTSVTMICKWISLISQSVPQSRAT